MATPPSQIEVDCCGHFAEAAAELSASPFLGQDSVNLGFTQVGDQITSYKVADPMVVNSMLFPFRRIWQKTEASNFGRVRSILVNHGRPEHVGLLGWLKQEWQRETTAFAKQGGKNEISRVDIVDLWLNTRAAHTGSSSRTGRFTRVDFDQWQKKLGGERLEYLFQEALFHFSICMKNLDGVNRLALRDWAENCNLKPTFFARETSGESNGLTTVEIMRKTPGVTPRPESDSEKIERLLRRPRFFILSTALKFCKINSVTLAEILNTGDCPQEVWRKFGIEAADGSAYFNAREHVASSHLFDDELRLAVSMVELPNGRALFDDPAIQVFEFKLAKLAELFKAS